MKMVTKSTNLDTSETQSFFNEIDWEWLLDFVRNTYGIGREQKPDVKLSETGHVKIGWQENLREQCGVFKNTYRDVHLTVFGSGFSRKVSIETELTGLTGILREKSRIRTATVCYPNQVFGWIFLFVTRCLMAGLITRISSMRYTKRVSDG